VSTSSLIAALFAAGDAGDLEAFDQYLRDDVVVHAPAGLSTVGLESERESWRKAKAAMPDIRHEFVDLFSSPTGEAGRSIVTGTMRGTYGGLSSEGRPFRIEQAVFTSETARSVNCGRSSIPPCCASNWAKRAPAKSASSWPPRSPMGR
jgi:predicted ester cyclase